MTTIGIIITMYREHDIVASSISEIKRCFSGSRSTIIVVHSDDKTSSNSLGLVRNLADSYELVPDLGKIYLRKVIPAVALCRNYSLGFRRLYETGKSFDGIVAFCGDTLITDATSFDRRFAEMAQNGHDVMAMQAIGQEFHAADADPEHGCCGGRYQDEETTDIMPQIIFLRGSFAQAQRVFSVIPITNYFTSEQCLGDELVRAMGSRQQFLMRRGRLAASSTGYTDGTVLHAQGWRE